MGLRTLLGNKSDIKSDMIGLVRGKGLLNAIVIDAYANVNLGTS